MRRLALVALLICAFCACRIVCLSADSPSGPPKDSAVKPKTESKPATSASAAAMRLLRATRSKIEGLASLKAQFVQEKRLAMLAEPVISKGEFLYKKGGKFIWHYLPPDESLTICDGEAVWLYFPALRRAELYHIKQFKSRSNIFEMLCLGFERPLCDLTDTFSIKLLRESKSNFVVRLVPLRERLARLIDSLEVLIDKESGLPMRIRSLERGGDLCTISFVKTELNPRLDDSVFVFTPGKDVIVQRKTKSLSY